MKLNLNVLSAAFVFLAKTLCGTQRFLLFLIGDHIHIADKESLVARIAVLILVMNAIADIGNATPFIELGGA